MISGGVFISNVPERCDVALNTTYLPADADANGYGSVPRGEIEAAVADAARGTTGSRLILPAGAGTRTTRRRRSIRRRPIIPLCRRLPRRWSRVRACGSTRRTTERC